MRDGGVLGFNSHYSYVFDTQWADLLAPINTTKDKADIIQQLNSSACNKFVHLSKDEQVKILKEAEIEDVNCKQILDALPADFPLLKGADYIVVESAKSLGLPVCVKPFLSNATHDNNLMYALKDFSLLFAEEKDGISADESHVHKLEHLEVFGEAVCRYKPQDITWCQEVLYHQPAAVTAAFTELGSADLKVWYKSAAILIRIPRWSTYREKLIAISSGDHDGANLEANTTAEDGAVNDFKDVIENYEDIVQEETQQLLDQVKELLDNEYINEVEGLVELLNKMQIKLNSNAMNAREQLESICSIKYDLHKLRSNIESETLMKVASLQSTMTSSSFAYLLRRLSYDSDNSD